jgi:hypothetical protein
LATRFRPIPIMSGMALAFMAKMGVAVTLGQAADLRATSLSGAVSRLSALMRRDWVQDRPVFVQAAPGGFAVSRRAGYTERLC